MSRSLGQKLWYDVKEFVTRNTHVKYEGPVFYCSKVMTKVEVFVYGRRRRQRQQQGRRRRQGYDNSSPDFRHGELKVMRDIPQSLLLQSQK